MSSIGKISFAVLSLVFVTREAWSDDNSANNSRSAQEIEADERGWSSLLRIIGHEKLPKSLNERLNLALAAVSLQIERGKYADARDAAILVETIAHGREPVIKDQATVLIAKSLIAENQNYKDANATVIRGVREISLDKKLNPLKEPSEFSLRLDNFLTSSFSLFSTAPSRLIELCSAISSAEETERDELMSAADIKCREALEKVVKARENQPADSRNRALALAAAAGSDPQQGEMWEGVPRCSWDVGDKSSSSSGGSTSGGGSGGGITTTSTTTSTTNRPTTSTTNSSTTSTSNRLSTSTTASTTASTTSSSTTTSTSLDVGDCNNPTDSACYEALPNPLDNENPRLGALLVTDPDPCIPAGCDRRPIELIDLVNTKFCPNLGVDRAADCRLKDGTTPAIENNGTQCKDLSASECSSVRGYYIRDTSCSPVCWFTTKSGGRQVSCTGTRTYPEATVSCQVTPGRDQTAAIVKYCDHQYDPGFITWANGTNENYHCGKSCEKRIKKASLNCQEVAVPAGRCGPPTNAGGASSTSASAQTSSSRGQSSSSSFSSSSSRVASSSSGFSSSSSFGQSTSPSGSSSSSRAASSSSGFSWSSSRASS